MSGIFHRVSIRKYQEKAVEPEKIEMLLRAAMAAPSACNQQPWEYYVVRDPQKIQALSKASPTQNVQQKRRLCLFPAIEMKELHQITLKSTSVLL